MDEIEMDEIEWEQEQFARIKEEQEVEDRLIEMMADWYEQQEADDDQ